MISYTGQESTGTRRMWAVIYALLSAAGIAVLVPVTRPTILDDPTTFALTLILGILASVFYAVSAVAACFSRAKYYWLENTMSWFGNMGLGIYLFTIAQAIANGEPDRVTQFFVVLALSTVTVTRSVRVQRYIAKHNRLRELVRIAIRNEARNATA